MRVDIGQPGAHQTTGCRHISRAVALNDPPWQVEQPPQQLGREPTSLEIADAIGSLTGDSRTVEALVVLWGAAVGSAVVDNIPFTAAMIPVVDELEGSDFHEATWWSLALGACFGGNATLIAAAANVAAAGVLERSGKRIRFGEFALVGIPITIVSLLFATVYVWLVIL